MEKSRLIFVKLPGTLFVGMEDPKDGRNLINPRLVFVDQEKQSVNLAPCMGSPAFVTIKSAPEYSYVNEDKYFAEFYFAETAPKVEDADVVKKPSVVQLVK